MIADPCLHGWGNAQGLMNPAEIVARIMERDCVLQILQFLLNALVNRVNRRIDIRIVLLQPISRCGDPRLR